MSDWKYSVPIEEKSEGSNCSSIRRQPKSIDGLDSTPFEGVTTLKQGWERIVKIQQDKPCLAQRRGGKQEYETKSYKEVDIIAREVGSGVKNLNLAPTVNEYEDLNLSFVGIYSKNREEWTIVDIGCGIIHGNTIIPLYDTLGPENITYCLKHNNLEVLFASTQSIDTILNKTKDLGKLQHIIAFDEITTTQQEKANERSIKLYAFDQIREEGRKNLSESDSITGDSINTFSYTSGTTGPPKGAMLTQQNWLSTCCLFTNSTSCQINSDDVYLSYLPLPHVFDRCVLFTMLLNGGVTYFYGGDVMKLKDDLKEVRPTIFCSVPRLYNKFYDGIQAMLNKATGEKATYIQKAIETKLDNLKKEQIYTHEEYDKTVFQPIRESMFGGRIRYCITGSAPISADVLNFFKIALSCHMIEGYGQTESSAGNFLTDHRDPTSGHVGGIQSNAEMKLEDIPEMGYFSSDKNEKGEFEPRGEVLLRGPGVFKGYYKDRLKTDEAIDKDGWLHTGDVGRIIESNGRLVLFDRKKNIFKLSQGEYVSPEKVENVYIKVSGVSEVFVHGDSLQSTCVGIIVPEQQFLIDLGKQLNLSSDLNFEQLCKYEEVVKYMIQQVYAEGKKSGLFGFEQIRSLCLEPVSLLQHGCFTNTMKLQRHIARKVFHDQIEAMYSKQMLI